MSVCSFFFGIYSGELTKLGKKHHVITNIGAGDAKRNSVPAKVVGYLDRLKRLKRIIETGQVDIVNTHHLGPFIHIIALKPFLKRKIRLVHTEHNPPDETIYSRHLLKLCLPLMKYADAVTGVSDTVAEYLNKTCHLPAGKARAILNGVNTKAFSDCDSRDRMRCAMGFDKADLVIGMIGNLRTEKNHRVLIRAFALLSESIPRLRLVLAGDGPCRKELELLTRELAVAERVFFLGHRLDAPEVMAMFDLYCLPSIYEGMPLSILEAWSAGKPVVATDVTGIRDIVVHETNGLLVPVNDPDALAEGMRRVLADHDLADRIAAQGRKFALEQCGMAEMVGRYEELYLHLMKAGPSS